MNIFLGIGRTPLALERSFSAASKLKSESVTNRFGNVTNRFRNGKYTNGRALVLG